MYSIELQFGFKRNMGWVVHMHCDNVLLSILSLVGSTVFMASALFGCKKAFDRVNHIQLLHRMSDIGVPCHIIKL